VEECLQYFRQAIADPKSVPPWSEWWAANADRVQEVFPLVDWVRLKHRKLLGARQILQHRNELPAEYLPPSPRDTGSCAECGERVKHVPGPDGSIFECPGCGAVS
jgi:hypothetical protein